MVETGNGLGVLAGRLELGDSGVLRSGRWLPLRALGWLLLLATVVEGPALSLPLLRGLLHRSPSLTPLIIAGLVLMSCSGYALLVRLGERRSPREFGLTSAPLQLAAGVAMGAGLMGLIYAVLLSVGLYQVHAGHVPAWPVRILYAFATAFIEELLFRAVVLRLVARVYGIGAGLGVSALLFGLAHLLAPQATLIAALSVALEAGLLLGACLLLTGRLWLAVGLHAGWNFTQGPVFGAVVSGHIGGDTLLISSPVSGASPLWSGGAFGPEASPIAVVVGLLAFAIVLMLAMRRVPAMSL